MNSCQQVVVSAGIRAERTPSQRSSDPHDIQYDVDAVEGSSVSGCAPR